MCNKLNSALLWVVVWGLCVASASFAEDDAAKGRAILEKHKSAVVTVQMVIKHSFSMMGSSRSEESKQEVTGAVIDPSGLTVLSLSATDPSGLIGNMMGGMLGDEDFDMQFDVTDVKILLEDGTEVPAREVLRDKDFDLAFVRPTTRPEKPMAALDLKQSDAPQILDRVVTLNRLGKVANRTYSASFEYIEAIVDKPRTFYIPGNDPTNSGLGSPAFTLDGDVVGLLVMRSIKTTDGGSMFDMRPEGMVGIIIPASDILEAARQAPPFEEEAECEERAGDAASS